MSKSFKENVQESQREADSHRLHPTSKELAQRVAALERQIAELQKLPTATAERQREAELRAELLRTEAERRALNELKARRVEYARRFADERLVLHPDVSEPATRLLAEYRKWAGTAPDVDAAECTIRREDFLQAIVDALPGSATVWGETPELEGGYPASGFLGLAIIPPNQTAESVLKELDAVAKAAVEDEELALARARELHGGALSADGLMARRRMAFAKLAAMGNGNGTGPAQ